MKDILIQIARTAVLCGTLGLALYFALSYAVQFPAFASGLVCAAAFAVLYLTVSSILYAIRHRLIPVKAGSISRDTQSVLYWAFLGFEIACALASIAIAVLSILRLIEATGSNA
ncbi:MAG: hypothetical protein J0G36_08635 [Afipia sp.]|nr:hypothetical protein [Afipia sp.]